MEVVIEYVKYAMVRPNLCYENNSSPTRKGEGLLNTVKPGKCNSNRNMTDVDKLQLAFQYKQC